MKKTVYALMAASALMCAPALANEEHQYNVPGRFFAENYDGEFFLEEVFAEDGATTQRVTWADSRSLSQSEIIRMQLALRNAGYEVGAIDGMIGTDTRNALSRYQNDNMLPGNGRINDTTLQALGVHDTVGEQYSSAYPFNY